MSNNDNLFIIIVVITILIILFFGGSGMMGNWSYGLGGMWMFGWLFMALILTALVLFIAWLVKQLRDKK